MRKTITVLLLLLGLLLAGIAILHYTGYDREIIRVTSHYIQRRNRPVNIEDRNYLDLFDDRNRTQLCSAKKFGIKQPLKNRSEAEKVKKELVRIKSNTHYKVDRLTHSIPYLTPGAAGLLDMIGKNFLDSLESKGLNPNRIIVTSVLRTQEDIKRLQQSGNPNATTNSAHCYATTFDITYARFDKIKAKGLCLYETVDSRTLKKVLSEVLLDLKKQKKCYVKYEVRQKCFHITTRM